MKLPEVMGQTYGAGAQVGLDGLCYRNCTFKAGCQVTYHGGPAPIEACTVEGGIVLDFQKNGAFW